MKKRFASWLAIVLCTAFVLTSCGGTPPEPAKTAPAASGAAASATPAASSAAAETPRKETLYIAGLIWGQPTNFNPIASNAQFPMGYNNSREIVYEPLFKFNLNTNSLEPGIGDSYKFVDDMTLEVKLNSAAHWSDGTPLTADDVAYTMQLGKKYTLHYSGQWTYLDNVVATDKATVQFKLKKEPYNRLFVLDALSKIYILPKAVWEKKEVAAGNDGSKLRDDFNKDPVASGPYKVYFYDNTKVVLIRDDNYWGKVRFGGQLPAPKYIAHAIYKDNAAGNLAFKSGQVDVSQQFIPNVGEYWKDGTPISTYLKQLPYYLPGSMPTIWFNTTKAPMDDPAFRRAIAFSIDYKMIGENAMTGYTDPIIPSMLMLNTTEKKYVDDAAVESSGLRWKFDPAQANKILDDAGYKKGPDGMRLDKSGKKISLKIECPHGWSDWEASLEVVSQSARKVGVEIQTSFPEQPTWASNRDQGTFDILMYTPNGAGAPSLPWARVYNVLYSKDVPDVGKGVAFRALGRYKNPQIDALIDKIPSLNEATQMDEIKKIYTEIDKLYLADAPVIPLMYRPWVFHTVNESVWTGFPKQGDGTNIPPTIAIDGAGIDALWKIKAK